MIIYINGKKSNWKQVESDYGKLFTQQLKEDMKKAPKYTSYHSQDGNLDIFK